MKDKKIVIAGAGGIGLYFGGRIAQHGFNVYFIARGETKKLLKEKGLKIESINGDADINSVQVIEDTATFGPADYILVTVKTYQIMDIVPLLKPLVGPQTTILPLENGIEAPYILGKALGDEYILGGLCMLSSFKISPNHIKHVALDPSITFGELQRPISPRVKDLQTILDGSGIKTTITDEFLVPYWTKMTFISTIGGIGAITRMPVGVFRSVPETRELIEQTINEIIAVAQKSGANLGKETFEYTLKTIDNLAPQTTASMQKDIMNNSPSELFEQTGTIVKLGKELGVDTPVNTFIFNSLLPSELEARKKS